MENQEHLPGREERVQLPQALHLLQGCGGVVSKGKLEALFGFCGCIQKNSRLPRLRGNSELSSKLQPAEPAQAGAGLCSVATASALLP